MKKKAWAVGIAAVLVICVVLFGSMYYRFISNTIYTESVSHLTEIFHQSDVSLEQMVDTTYSNVRLWADYLESGSSEEAIRAQLEEADREAGFSDFYFISREGKYLSLSGEKGYLDFKSDLSELIIDREDVALSSAIPGKPQQMVFATPAEASTFEGFEYEAVGVGYSNSAFVENLKIKAFNGEASSFVIHSDGRVVIDTSQAEHDPVYNLLSTFSKHSDLSEESLSRIDEDFNNGKKGSCLITIMGTKCYLIYEPVGIDDWLMASIVPSKTVNASMSKLQSITFVIVALIMFVIGSAVFILLLHRNRSRLKAKDVQIMFRDEMFDKVSINSNDVFLMLDSDDFKVDYVSPNIEKLTGIPEEQARKDIHEIDRLIDFSDVELIWEHLYEILPGEQKEWDREYVHLITGESRWFHVTAYCSDIMDKKKYILVMSDRTKDRQINRELEAAVSAAENALGMAEAANKAKSTFLSNMSHDIRTPLNAIIGFATLGLAGFEDKMKVRDYFSKILSSGNHLLSLINDILDMSRIENGKITLEETESNLSDMLHDIKTIIGGQIQAKQLELFMDVRNVTDENVYCDRTRFNQVLLNLLSNAIKFTPTGGTISVSIAQLENGSENTGTYEIKISDTGIGMSPEFAEKIFEPFEREKSSTVSKIQGTGLGMTISKSIIDMMGGSISFVTEKNAGTEFTIRIPLRINTAGSAEKIKIEELEGLKALVVDDDFNTCDSVTKMLAKVGMKPDWTFSGKEAVFRARQSLEMNNGFHAYIIDWRLPDMNGIEVTRQIRSLGDETPIIILTAYDWDNIEEEAKEAGVTAFCSKPMFMSDLRDALLTSLGQKSGGNEHNLLNIDKANGFEGKKLLLVEDNELNREIAVEILSEHGFDMDVAVNGAEAVEKLLESGAGTYDAVLMDIQMPVMDGYEATRQIRAFDDPQLASVPVIAMTANAFNEDRKAAEECGMDGFMSKPIDMDEVVRVLQEVLGRR